MLNLKELDKKYKVADEGTNLSLFNMSETYWDDDMSVSEAVEKVKNGEINKCFSTDSSSDFEDFLVARDLNIELGFVPDDTYVLLFGHLDHLISKEPISYPAFFKRTGDWIDKEIDFINQVLGLIPDKGEDPKRMKYFRHLLKNMLKTGCADTVEDLLKGSVMED